MNETLKVLETRRSCRKFMSDLSKCEIVCKENQREDRRG